MLKDVSLSTVKAFESAARHGSFRAAASELNLSPSAISHSILKLEQTLGTNLFERDGRIVRLSPEGESLMLHVGLAFDELRRGTELVSNRGPQLLRLHSAPSFAGQWLTPRLSRFLSSHPGVEVRLAASTDYARFANDEFDADIVYGPTRAEATVSIPLGVETVTPLCSPEFAERINAIDDLVGEVLIQSGRSIPTVPLACRGRPKWGRLCLRRPRRKGGSGDAADSRQSGGGRAHRAQAVAGPAAGGSGSSLGVATPLD
jgi:LysR family glycine cleavage system transcriptional activator